MTMNLDHEELHRLLATLAESDIQEFRLEGEDFCLEVKRNLGPSIDSIATQKVITPEEIDPPLPQRKIDTSPTPSTPLEVHAAPGPMPTRTPDTPALIRLRATLYVTQLPTITGIPSVSQRFDISKFD